ncbi:capsid decoration protein [Rhodococcus phage ChewyVIII]|uniref:Capsid decoration protein n=1 Tax=Rhodococcus phage ChewyVIII TaxID=1887657 RepID=A0A1C9EI59_9CAUD|nr:capsid decoration protein [Rhodococcus phage ChewyVIII]AON97464.1 capsid decoration protein [Rhodococcus phage ChewyVIII]
MAGYTPTRATDKVIEDYTWLADYDGLFTAESGTLDATSLSVAGGHRLENWLKSGTPLGKITSGAKKGQFGLYDPAASDGREKHYGFLKAEIQLVDNVSGVANKPLTGAVLNHGQILVNRLPVVFDPALASASPKFIYR